MTRYLLLLLPLLATGCQTTVGNYFANRGRDLGECFLVQVGGGLGLGVDVKAAGVVHASAILNGYLPPATVGWLYGEPRPAKVIDYGHWYLDGDFGVLVLHVSHRPRNGEGHQHQCYGLVPAVLSWEDDVWIWGDAAEASREDFEAIEHWPPGSDPEQWLEDMTELTRVTNRWARVHTFDIEAGVFALIVGARAGFSPGEFLDFLLGWVGIDIAGDDQPLEVAPAPDRASGPPGDPRE